MGDEKGKKKPGGLGGLLVKVLVLAVLLAVGFEIAAHYTGDFDLSPLTRLRRLFGP